MNPLGMISGELTVVCQGLLEQVVSGIFRRQIVKRLLQAALLDGLLQKCGRVERRLRNVPILVGRCRRQPPAGQIARQRQYRMGGAHFQFAGGG